VKQSTVVTVLQIQSSDRPFCTAQKDDAALNQSMIVNCQPLVQKGDSARQSTMNYCTTTCLQVFIQTTNAEDQTAPADCQVSFA